MDFASESLRDSFPLPQTRQAPANAAPRDDGGRSFDDHLNAVYEPRPERPAPQREARDELPAPVEARAEGADATEDIDADTTLLGGPLPPAPPPMAASVALQIAVAQPKQAPQTQSQLDSENAQLAPPSALQAPPPAIPAKETETAAAAEPVAPHAPTLGKSDAPDVKDAAPKPTPTESASPPQPEAHQVASTAQTDLERAQLTAQQAANTAANTQVATSDLPQAMQQAIAAIIAPVPQATTQAPQPSTKDATQAIDAKSTPAARDGKPEPISNAKAQASAAKNADTGKIAVDALPASPTQSAAPDTSQLAENSALSATTSQASTHVQQTAAETGAQRAAPAAAQVGREIIRRFNGGTTNFELRLDPADLGRVEVRMEVTRDHRVTAVITADNPQALTELARGARELEQQLQSAGLQVSENGLSFDLRQGAQGRGDADETKSGARSSGEVAPTEQQAPVARPIGYERWRGVRVDMMV